MWNDSSSIKRKFCQVGLALGLAATPPHLRIAALTTRRFEVVQHRCPHLRPRFSFLTRKIEVSAGELDPTKAVRVPFRPEGINRGVVGVTHSDLEVGDVPLMAPSDNVVRAGLTHKHEDAAQLVEIAEFSALPPIRLAPGHPTPTTDRFLAPVQEFELGVSALTGEDGRVSIPGEV